MAKGDTNDTIPMEAGQVKKGGYMMIKGKACKILSISVSKTGKHGHAKCNFVGVDIFSGKKLEDVIPSTHVIKVPIVRRTDWELIDIDDNDDSVILMDECGNEERKMNLLKYPDGLANEIWMVWNCGENAVDVTVQSAIGIERIVAWNKDH